MRPVLAVTFVALLGFAMLAGCSSNTTVTPPPPPPPAAHACDTPCDKAVAANPWFEYEPSIAVNPKDPKNIVIGVHDDPFGTDPAHAGDCPQGVPVIGSPILGPGCFLLSAYTSTD